MSENSFRAHVKLGCWKTTWLNGYKAAFLWKVCKIPAFINLMLPSRIGGVMVLHRMPGRSSIWMLGFIQRCPFCSFRLGRNHASESFLMGEGSAGL